MTVFDGCRGIPALYGVRNVDKTGTQMGKYNEGLTILVDPIDIFDARWPSSFWRLSWDG